MTKQGDKFNSLTGRLSPSSETEKAHNGSNDSGTNKGSNNPTDGVNDIKTHGNPPKSDMPNSTTKLNTAILYFSSRSLTPCTPGQDPQLDKCFPLEKYQELSGELKKQIKKGFAADADTFVSQIQNAMEVSQ